MTAKHTVQQLGSTQREPGCFERRTMPKIITVTSGKGGVGKSSLCTGLSRAFVSLGEKVLLVELDVGLRGIDVMLGLTDRVVYDLGDVLAGRCYPDKAILPGEEGRPDYLAAPGTAGEDLSSAALQELITRFSKRYSHIIIDTPAGLGFGVMNLLPVTDLALIVATPDPVSIRAGSKVAYLLEQQDFHRYGLLINRVSKAGIRKSSIRDLDDVMDGVGAPLKGVIIEETAFRLALEQGLPPDEKGAAWQALCCIARRLNGERVPLSIRHI